MLITPDKTIPTKTSTTDDWINWHSQCRKMFGKKTANTLFLKAWEKRGNDKSNNRALRNYLEKYGLNLDASGWANASDKALDFTDMIGNVFRVGGYVAVGFGALILIAISIGIINMAVHPDKATEGATRGIGKVLKIG